MRKEIIMLLSYDETELREQHSLRTKGLLTFNKFLVRCFSGKLQYISSVSYYTEILEKKWTL